MRRDRGSEIGEPFVDCREPGRRCHDGLEVVVRQRWHAHALENEVAQVRFNEAACLPIEGQTVQHAQAACSAAIASLDEREIRRRVHQVNVRRDQRCDDSPGVGPIGDVAKGYASAYYLMRDSLDSKPRCDGLREKRIAPSARLEHFPLHSVRNGKSPFLCAVRLILVEAFTLPEGRTTRCCLPKLLVIRLVKFSKRETCPASTAKGERRSASKLQEKISRGLRRQQGHLEFRS